MYPDKLIKYLYEQAEEGNTITTTHSYDGIIWIIKQKDLKDWYVICEWYEGKETFNLINLCGNAFSEFKKLLEMNK